MHVRKIILFCLLIFSHFLASTQRPIIKTYDTNDGLLTNQVRNIYQDKKGFIWIATWEGLSKFDGNKFSNYSIYNGLSHSVVNDIIDSDNKLFIALNDGSLDYIQNGHIQNKTKVPSGLNQFFRIHHEKWLIPSDMSGIYELSNGTIHKPKQENIKFGHQFLVTFNDSLIICINNNGKVSVYSSDYKLLSSSTFENLWIFNVYKEKNNRVWLCTDKGIRLLHFDWQSKKCTSILPPPDLFPTWLNNITVNAIIKADDGSFWISSKKGLIRIFSSGNYYLLTKEDGLPSTFINTILQDNEKNIWLGTDMGIAKIVTKNEINTIPVFDKQTVSSVYSAAVLNPSQIIINTSVGPKIFDPKTYRIKELSYSETNPLIYFTGTNPRIFYDDNSFYSYDSTKNKFNRFSSKKISFPIALHTAVDREGNAFIARADKMIFISGKKVFEKKIKWFPVMAMTIDKQGFLWVGTWDKLFRIRYNFNRDSVDFTLQNFSHLLPDKLVRSLFTDSNGNIWVGTRYNGAYRLTPKEEDSYDIEAFNQKAGFSSNYVMSFAESQTGDIWLGTLNGLDKLVKSGKEYQVYNFSQINNLYGSVSQIITSGQNTWWCVFNNNRLIRFTDQFLENSPPLKVEITEAILGNGDKKIHLFQSDTTISLSYSDNQASFEFSAAGFINEKQVMYSYRLIGGKDTSWSTPRNVHEVSYANLQPGDYIFEVRNHGWNNQIGKITIFQFNIAPPFWQKSWFIILCGILILSIFYIIYRYRLRQIYKLQEVRYGIATNLHDDIGSTLTNIGILTELSQKHISDKETAGHYLERISEEVSASGQSLDDIIWNVNSKNDSLDEMIIRMRRFASELFDHTSTQCKLQLLPESTDKKIRMDQRRDIYLIYKEALNNIYKHAEAKNVEIILELTGNLLNLTIRDDGKGFETSKESHRNGLKNIKKRIDNWKGTIHIESGIVIGTKITIELPVKY